ncbi:methylosome subunit pICln-like [Apostichopus japonicus]|uniref:methylosome subunit pICln-like n=1 Tax=Stichopus japonicus TaxID=307972 RepID=UPI003AB4DC0D
MANFLTAVRTEDCAIVHATEENVKAFVNNNEVAAGKLIISESVMSWQKMDGQGLSLPYPAISLHAVSRDLNAFPHECLYLMIDPEKLPNDILGRINHEEMEGDEEEIVEIRFVPQNGSTLGRLFDALSECQLLHPDPADEDLSDDYVDAEEDQAEEAVGVCGGGDGTASMQQLSISQSTSNGHHTEDTSRSGTSQDLEAGQFDDAEDIDAD